ncbi:MAG: LL-diaminopimelate aminotransferase [Candidatus Gastranaerophilales bacterium]|nr:LL-diaminopimelate aminotransferase [Candidatus Gastranaerophilales bacterium]
MKTTVKFTPSKKLLDLPTYIFAELDEWKAVARANGADLIDLGMGNPDGATPEPILQAAIKSIQNPANHGYPSFKGKEEFRIEISNWMKRKYNVDINPEDEIQTLIGAKEGLAHLAMAYTNPGDINIVPDPYYPVLSRGTWISNGDVYHVKLKEENSFLPNFDEIPVEIAQKAKIFFVNYPNNPTSAIETKEFYIELVDFCTKYNILLCTDLAYGEICYDGYRPPSIFEIDGAKDIAIEFHSFSKTFNMAGWRIGWACGNKDIVKTLCAMKSNIDYGTTAIIQDAAIEALRIDDCHVKKIVDKYQDRRDFMIEGFNKLGWNLKKTLSTMYLWLKVPQGYTSRDWCKYVMDTAEVVFTPGLAFGRYSDDYFRVSLVAPDDRLKEALARLEKYNIKFQ